MLEKDIIEEENGSAFIERPLVLRIARFLWDHRRAICLVVVFCGMVFWLVPSGFRAGLGFWERRQALDLANRGVAYVQGGDWQAARMSAETSLRLLPDNPEALRLLAEILQFEGRSNELFDVYQRLAQSGYASIEEFKTFARLADKNHYRNISDWLAGWVAQQGEADFPHLLRASRFEAEGQNLQALIELRQAVALSNSRFARLELARLLLASSEHGESNIEIHSLLANLSESRDSLGLEALMVGMFSGVVPPESRLAWAEQLRHHPLADPKTRAAADAWEVAFDPSSKPRLIEETVQAALKQPLADRLIAARWLQRQQAPVRVSEILPLELARSDLEAFALWLDAQASLDNWQSILEAIQALPGGGRPVSLELLRCLALKKLGRPNDSAAAFRQVIHNVSYSPEQSIGILVFLHQNSEQELFEKMVRPFLARSDSALSVLQVIARRIRESGDGRALRVFFEMAASIVPCELQPLIKNELDYIDLLSRRQVDLDQIAARFDAAPENHAFRFTYALSELLAGNEAKALVIAESPELRVRDLSPQHQLVLACVWAANGDQFKATKAKELLNVEPMIKSEHEILRLYVR